MEYIPEDTLADVPKGRVLCCDCGILMDPNPSGLCVSCVRSQIDITQDIPKQATLYFCRGCDRYLQPPSEWVPCALESRELMTVCLHKLKLKSLDRIKLINASFIWTEPHSKRIKLKLTVVAEIIGGAILQQTFVVDFNVNHQMCDDCHRTEAQNYWRAMVQVRQKTENKKTFYYMEQLILKHKAHVNTLGMKPSGDGIDFYYATEAHARKMVDFLRTVLPCRYQHSKKLISHDIHSNIYNNKYTYSVEIVPLSKDSVVCLPKKLTQKMGGITSLCLVYRVANTIHLIDPCTAQIAEMSNEIFWQYQFKSICDPKQLVEYIVMDVEPILEKDKRYFPGQGPISTKHVPADIWLVKASELGSNDNMIHTRTHLGYILKPGDSVMGYNLEDSNVNDGNFEKLDRSNIPDVILVKKHYPDRAARRRHRTWKLKHLAVEENLFDPAMKDYDDFLDELEEDPELRQNVNIFKDKTKVMPVDKDEVVDPDVPHVTLEEMLDDLEICDDVEMAE